MSITSGEFLLFFTALLAVYWLLPRNAWQNLLLLIAGYAFYGWVHPWYAVLLGLSTLTDYGLTRRMAARPDRRGILLALSLLINLGILAFFKYYDFFGPDLARALAALGMDPSLLLVKIILPAGLSFYTLKKIACVIDISRGTSPAPLNLVNFALFVSFFPQLLAGPIDRARTLMPQIEGRRAWKAEYFHAAWPLLVTGLFKKIVVADSLRVLVDRIFLLAEPTRLLVLAGTLGFAVQILADFSAYTDLARGLAYLLGFETPRNFRRPYLALTPADFWNRWHITLSHWLRDYIFFPVRRALLRTKSLPKTLVLIVPPLVTMLACGLWHGTSATFLAWGLYHGLLIAGYQVAGLGGDWKPSGVLRVALAWLLMSGFTLFGWLLFRAPSLEWLGTVWHAPWTLGVDDRAVALIMLAMTAAYGLPLGLLALLEHLPKGRDWPGGLFHALALAAVVIYLNPSPPDFIYFQF